jgi:hypothetical protein
MTRSRGSDELSFGRFVLGYLVILAGVLGLTFAGEHYLHVGSTRLIFGLCGLLFLVAAGGWPAWVYQVVRRVRWFARIESDQTMRLVLVGLGSALILTALCLREAA